jgi:hypothetical protein
VARSYQAGLLAQQQLKQPFHGLSRIQKSSRIQNVSKGLNLYFITAKLFTLTQEFSLPQLTWIGHPLEHTYTDLFGCVSQWFAVAYVDILHPTAKSSNAIFIVTIIAKHTVPFQKGLPLAGAIFNTKP